LWGEVNRFISGCKEPLLYDPKHGIETGLVMNQRELRMMVNGKLDDVSYVRGMVASADTLAAMQGHHATPGPEHLELKPPDMSLHDYLAIPRSMFVSDESSSVPDDYYKMADTWAERMLIFGNSWPCANFFKRAVKGNPKTKDRGGDLAWA
jgi:hypothetical protein